MKKPIYFIAILVMSLFAMNRLTAQETQKIQYPPGTTAATTQSHQIQPSNTLNISIEDNKNERFMKLAGQTNTPSAAGASKLNVTQFGQSMHQNLKDSVTGYVLRVTQNGNIIYSLKWNWGQTPADASQGWEFDTRMHVASVSKYITALGMMKALKLKGISYDAKIVGYLPTYWVKGSNINLITFRHLLTHTSGFSTGGSSSNYIFMKDNVKSGISGVGGYDYENMNFGLCRILIPIIMGYVDKNAIWTDQVWDALTVAWYKVFMQVIVFTPSGVANADFEPEPITKNALAYNYPHNNQDGWNSGNLSSMSGGAGWRLSVTEVLKVMDHAKRKGTILPAADIQYGLDNKLGIDQIISTPAGNMYNKNGRWSSGSGLTEQSVAYFLPNNMELVVFVNSPIGKAKSSLRGLVKDVFLNSLTL